jgi:hypothetical protein
VPASWLLTVPLAAALLLPAVTAVIVGIRGHTGSLRRSSKLGVHGPAAEASDEAFALANRVAAPVTLAAGLVLAIGALLTIGLRLGPLPTVVLFAVAVVGGITLLVSAGSLGERAATTVPPQAGRPVGCGSCVCGSGGCAGLTRATAPRSTAPRPTAQSPRGG